MHLLLDTQILVWMVIGDVRLRAEWIAAISNADAILQVSAVTAFEYADLQMRDGLPVTETMDELIGRFDLAVTPLPVDCWRRARDLPPIHGDPVDRMLIAHAMAEDATLVTADANIRRYPVPFI